MKLKELKCENCGASLKVKENETQVKCEFCNTNFAVEDAYNEGYKFEKGRMKAINEHVEQNLEKIKKPMKIFGGAFAAHAIITAIISFVIIATVVIMIIFGISKQNDSMDDFEINRFNSKYEMYVGTEYGTSVGILIDNIITNNKKNQEHQIIIKYGENQTKEPDLMQKIKKQINSYDKYEVTFEYDKNGLIYLAMIE